MDFYSRMIAVGIAPDEAGDIMARYLDAGDVDGLEQYVVICEALAPMM